MLTICRSPTDISTHMNTTDLLAKELSVLNWSSVRVVLIAHAINALIKLRTVNLTRWAVVFETDAQMSSNYKRLQRFFRFFELDSEALAKLIARWLPCEPWVLCLDRTNWQIGSTRVNILMLAVAHRGIAVPLLWTMLDKKGNSHTDERIALMKRFIALFSMQRIAYLTGLDTLQEAAGTPDWVGRDAFCGMPWTI
jgi:hypothetical protein